jgi:DNA polymerase-3 subunit delta'
MLLGHTKQITRLTKLAKQGELSHGYIFFGEPHIGKRTSAEALANYFETGELGTTRERPLADAHTITPDVKTQVIGIDAIREMLAFLSRKPNTSNYRTLIIDDAHTLTGEAANALLKITEEPPVSALIILIVQDHGLLLPTIQSRLEKIYFAGGMKKGEVAQWLMSTHGAKKEDAVRAAERSFGVPGLAWSMLYDPQFRTLQEQAKKFFSLRGKEKQDFIKELTATDETISASEAFHFDRFLEALVYASMPLTARNTAFMSACLKLREQAGYLNLNPRLQLTALAESWFI